MPNAISFLTPSFSTQKVNWYYPSPPSHKSSVSIYNHGFMLCCVCDIVGQWHKDRTPAFPQPELALLLRWWSPGKWLLLGQGNSFLGDWKNTFREKGKKTNSYSVAIGVDISVFCKPVLYILVLPVPRENMDVRRSVNSF